MISLRAALLILLFGALLFLAMRTPGVLVYDYLAQRLRGRGQPPQDVHKQDPSAAPRPNQARQPG
ncbi:MAG: hypothetical protein J0I68_23920 [Achromobacter sp.]|jgi:hypothetical protein|uniref:Uncharacterized protein n=1 Tax=Achromobacter insuavis TaxID=1287735 RepID=A0A6J5HZF2_9BURK|nr:MULTISPECIES: hypothetical protein [Achromobacter]MBN9641608.1 hypothetical protein [Achromobacter sp.]MCG2596983.1 hypothetical protein [Achromobacter sp.]MCG2604750.1 hypothetical protein [Achromobacter sp.]CAB3634324.1 hypothetical protein LMG26845_01505 [Achromobacter insuavis]CAB3878124.1 hypothetical protein LMG26846_03352 [Achromobacter insuavis]